MTCLGLGISDCRRKAKDLTRAWTMSPSSPYRSDVNQKRKGQHTAVSEGMSYCQGHTFSDINETRPPSKYDAVITRESDRRRDIFLQVYRDRTQPTLINQRIQIHTIKQVCHHQFGLVRRDRRSASVTESALVTQLSRRQGAHFAPPWCNVPYQGQRY